MSGMLSHAPFRRTRTGCLTCRLRRKKCDESVDRTASCGTCSRLSLDCLGYAAKRPQWMQDPAKIAECKREIRCWVADRGRTPRTKERLSFEKYFGDGDALPPPPPMKSTRRRESYDVSWDTDEEDMLSEETSIKESPLPQRPILPPLFEVLARLSGSNTIPSDIKVLLKQLVSDPSFPEMYPVIIAHGEESDVKPGAALDTCQLLDSLDPSAFSSTLRKFVADLHSLRELTTVPESKPPVSGLAKLAQGSDVGDLTTAFSIPKEDLVRLLALVLGLNYVMFSESKDGWRPTLNTAYALFGSNEDCPYSQYPIAMRLIFETAVWMDLMSSVSLCQSPILFDLYPRFLSSSDAKDAPHIAHIMGCDSQTALGVAHIASLAQWKEDQLARGSLDVYILSQRARDIQHTFLTPEHLIQESTASHHSTSYETAFRAAARIHLHCIVIGSFPEAPSIATAVSEALVALHRVPSSSIDHRSLIYSLTITASVARDMTERQYLLDRLKFLGDVRRLGHGHQALRLVEEVWLRRQKSMDQRQSVDWWSVMRDSPNFVVLLA